MIKIDAVIQLKEKIYSIIKHMLNWILNNLRAKCSNSSTQIPMVNKIFGEIYAKWE